MSNVKHIDIGEFRRLGFLQEANRLFFHPHGLALEVTTVTDKDGENAFSTISLLDKELWALGALIEVERRRRTEGEGTADLDALTRRIEEAKRYELGEAYISGVWDYRDDPEGLLYGDWPEDALEKARVVAENRERRRGARAALFGGARDVEPLGFVWVEPTETVTS